MILLKKKLEDGTYFEFDKILSNGYKIKEDYDRTTQKFVNGRRKQFLSNYVDCTITIDLGTLDLNTTYEYLQKLTEGTYQYYSFKEKKYKETSFILQEIPEIIVDRFYDNDAIINDYSITLLKAGD